MVAVGRDHAIMRLTGRDNAGGDRFLPDVQVHKSADFSCLIQFCAALFHAADQNHLMI